MSTFLWAFLAFAIGLTIGHSMVLSTTAEAINELAEISKKQSQAMNNYIVSKIRYDTLVEELESRLKELDDIEELDA